jgi:molybdenum cofactor synthesis domain-containing protein
MDVGVVTVGDELLAGETENTNASWLARQLGERGVSVLRIMVVPDELAAISSTVRDLQGQYDAVIVTGGVGPTHDDVTMEAVARAFDREMAEHPDAVEWFQTETEYAREDLVQGTSYLPAGSRMIPNPNGVAPGAVVENVYVLPGVPEEMKGMFGEIESEFSGTILATEVVHSENPESSMVDVLREVTERFEVRVGSYPNGTVRIKIQGEDPEEVREAASWLAERV